MPEQSDRAAARDALYDVRRFIRAGVRRGLPPRWYNLVLAAVYGGLANRFADVTGSDAARLDFYAWWIGLTLATGGIQYFGWRAWGAAARYGPMHWSLHVVSWLSVIVLGTLGAAPKAYWDQGWGPWAAGAAVWTIVFTAMEIHRLTVLARDADGLV